MNKKLEKFHEWLKENYENYVCMIGTGSFITGDNWIEGKSDKDIVLIFEKNYNEGIYKINKIIKEIKFDETYLFVPMLKKRYLKNRNHSHDFSGKFRSKVLFGPNIILEKKLPNKEKTRKIFEKGLENVKRRLERAIINESIWSDKKVQKTLWKLFKHTFMYLAIKYYYENGVYPVRRVDLINKEKNKILKKTLNTLNKINIKEREELLKTGKELLNYLKRI